jgi:NarL family two-component system response regulator LiaR
LLVEDEADNRRMLRELLEQEGIPVVGEAGDGVEGIELAQKLLPDVVLMDLRMPSIGGVDATRLIKEFLPLTKVVVLTTYDDPFLRRAAQEAGTSAYLLKESSAQQICDAIFEVVGLATD